MPNQNTERQMLQKITQMALNRQIWLETLKFEPKVAEFQQKVAKKVAILENLLKMLTQGNS